MRGDSVRVHYRIRPAPDAHIFGYGGQHTKERVCKTLVGLGAHPNVGGTLVVGVGTEGTDFDGLLSEIEGSKRPAEKVIVSEPRSFAGGKTAICNCHRKGAPSVGLRRDIVNSGFPRSGNDTKL